jgi:hypothetical protein
VERVKSLVEVGALPRLQLQKVQDALGDAEDDAVLSRTLFRNLPDKDYTDDLIAAMLSAAEREVDRQQARIDQAKKLIADGLEPGADLAPLETDLALRRTTLDLARSHAKMMNDLTALAQLEQSIGDSEELARGDQGGVVDMEHFEGSGIFQESRDLKLIQAAFAQKFERPLPVSADGETSLHRALGFDHRGRVDVAVGPNTPEGIWLREYLKSRGIPYYAFTHAMPGKATAAHIHIGPGSTRLVSAD